MSATEKPAAGERERLLAALVADAQRARAAIEATGANICCASYLHPHIHTDIRHREVSVGGRWTSDALGAISDEHGVGVAIPCRGTAEHIAAHDPETVLRRNAGVRAVVEMHKPYSWEADPMCAGCRTFTLPCPTIRALADAYAPRWDKP